MYGDSLPLIDDKAIFIENSGSSANTCMCNLICDILLYPNAYNPYMQCLTNKIQGPFGWV